MLFQNIKILDLTRVLSGPLATRHLAVQGAMVIKIEPPTGDDTRYFPPLMGDWSGYFEVLNHNKQSIVLDLKLVQDLERFYELCKSADVIVENYSPSVKNKLKINYEIVSKLNPKIIYASICGTTQESDRKYYDIIAQAESGLIDLNKTNNTTAIVDSFVATKLAFAIAGALYSRERTNQGQNISVSMLGCAFDLLEQNLIESSVIRQQAKVAVAKNIYQQDSAICPFGVFYTLTSDIAIATGNEKVWNIFCQFLAEKNSKFDFKSYISNQKRLDNKQLIYENIQKVLDNHTAESLHNQLQKLGIPSGIVSSMQDINDNQSYFEHGLLQKVDIPKIGKITVPTGGIYFENSPNVQYKPAPKLNQHTNEI